VTHDEANDLAGLYVLDALLPDERAAVDDHLASCPLAHPDFAELGSVVPALASSAEPVGAPAALKRRVREAYVADRRQLDGSASPSLPVAPAVRRAPARQPVSGWLGWAVAAAAVLVLAVVSVWAVGVRSAADRANERASQLNQAIAAMTQQGSQVALLHGSGQAAAVGGFVAIPPDGSGWMVMTDVPAAPSGTTYQAWYIANGTPVSAGLMSADKDGRVIASGIRPVPGTSVVAVTIEPAGGSQQPTSAPIIVGTLSAAT
jgi:hypothetical protein